MTGAYFIERKPSQMKALSIRQPWVWLIVNASKDIENRQWKFPTQFRGDFYIHASKGCTKSEYEDAVAFAECIDSSIVVPPLDQLDRGGLVAIATLTDCVTRSDSPWYVGGLGLVLENIRPIDFIPCKGQLGFFNPGQ